MRIQDKADQIEALFESIKNIAGASPGSSLMLHDVDYVYDLDESWKQETTYVNNQITLNVRKGGIVLFGQTFKVDREPIESDEAEEANHESD